MRTGAAVKTAIAVTLKKTWEAARQQGMPLFELHLSFAGTGARMSKRDRCGVKALLDVFIQLPDFDDKRIYNATVIDRMVAMALHELGHAWFTDDNQWNYAMETNGGSMELHRCINAFEDVRQERKIIDSGYAVGAGSLLPVLLRHMVKDCTTESFEQVTNVAFAVCVDGRGYGVSVAHLMPPKFKGIFDQAVAKCATLKTTDDAANAGVWLWKELASARDDEKKQKQGIKVGDKVKSKTTGKVGVVVSINEGIAEVENV